MDSSWVPEIVAGVAPGDWGGVLVLDVDSGACTLGCAPGRGGGGGGGGGRPPYVVGDGEPAAPPTLRLPREPTAALTGDLSVAAMLGGSAARAAAAAGAAGSGSASACTCCACAPSRAAGYAAPPSGGERAAAGAARDAFARFLVGVLGDYRAFTAAPRPGAPPAFNAPAFLEATPPGCVPLARALIATRVRSRAGAPAHLLVPSPGGGGHSRTGAPPQAFEMLLRTQDGPGRERYNAIYSAGTGARGARRLEAWADPPPVTRTLFVPPPPARALGGTVPDCAHASCAPLAAELPAHVTDGAGAVVRAVAPAAGGGGYFTTGGGGGRRARWGTVRPSTLRRGRACGGSARSRLPSA